MLFACLILFFYFFAQELLMRNPAWTLGVALGVMVLTILRTTIIVIEHNLLRAYDIVSLFTRRPVRVFLDDIQKMHIVHDSSRSDSQIHLKLRNDEITINTRFSKGDIESLEHFIMERGIEVQNPEQ